MYAASGASRLGFGACKHVGTSRHRPKASGIPGIRGETLLTPTLRVSGEEVKVSLSVLCLKLGWGMHSDNTLSGITIRCLSHGQPRQEPRGTLNRLGSLGVLGTPWL